jgi:hypothetical protein
VCVLGTVAAGLSGPAPLPQGRANGGNAGRRRRPAARSDDSGGSYGGSVVKIALIGGTGSFGLALAVRLREAGYAVDEADLSLKQIRGVGIGAPGAVDGEAGNVIFAPNLDWHDVALKKELEKQNQIKHLLKINQKNRFKLICLLMMKMKIMTTLIYRNSTVKLQKITLTIFTLNVLFKIMMKFLN